MKQRQSVGESLQDTRDIDAYLHFVVSLIDAVPQVDKKTDTRLQETPIKASVLVDIGTKHGDDGPEIPLRQLLAELDVAHYVAQ